MFVHTYKYLYLHMINHQDFFLIFVMTLQMISILIFKILQLRKENNEKNEKTQCGK